MRNERPDPIDALIDEAARRLVAGEPSSSLRRSVRDRIGRRRSAWWAFAPALAGAAVVIIAIVGRAIVGPAESARARVVAPDAARVSSTADLQPVEVTSTQLEQSEPRQSNHRRAAPTLPPDEEPIVPPIMIEPLRTAPLAEAQISADVSSGVMPIDIAPLQIEPLLGQ